MLRRASKRKQERSVSAKEAITEPQVAGSDVLGDETSSFNRVEQILEEAVFGGEEEIIDILEKQSTKSKKKKRSDKEHPKPAWEDDDDTNIKVTVSKADFRHKYFKHEHEQEVSSTKYTEALKKQFEKVTGTPHWAKLKCEQSDSEKDDSDSEVADVLQSTGNYLATSDSLPRGVIQMKKCSDITKSITPQGKLRSVEFHPSSQVALCAGMNHTLTLFQVDGKDNPKIQSVFLEKYPIYTAHFTRDGTQVIMGGQYNSFYYYDLIAGKVVKVPQIKGIDQGTTKKFVLSPDGSTMAILGCYGYIHLLCAKSKEWLTSVKMNGSVEAVIFSQDGSRMFSHGDDGEVYVWEMRTRQCVHKFRDEGCIKGTALAASANGQFIAAGSYSGVVNLYDEQCLTSANPTPVKAIMNLTSPCTQLTFNPATEILAMASNYTETAVKFVHLPSVTVFSNFPDRISDRNIRIPFCMDFSVNGGYFTVSNNTGRAILYRVKHYNNY